MDKTHYLMPEDIQRYGLDDLPLFSLMSHDHLKQFVSVCKVFNYREDEIIIQQGIRQPWVYILLSGKIRVMVNEVEVTVLHERGDVFGEAPLVESGVSTASISTLGPVSCLAIDSILLKEVHTKGNEIFNAYFYQFITKLLIGRLSKVSEELALVKSVFKNMQMASSSKQEGETPPDTEL